MEKFEKIQKLLREAVESVRGISECSIVNSDGFNIMSSSSDPQQCEINGDLISEILDSGNKMTDSVFKQKIEKLIVNFSKNEVVIIKLSEHIFFTFFTESSSDRALMLHNLNPYIKQLKNLMRDY